MYGKPEFKNEEDFDTFVAKYRGYMRYSYGFSDWRGMVGSKGEGPLPLNEKTKAKK